MRLVTGNNGRCESGPLLQWVHLSPVGGVCIIISTVELNAEELGLARMRLGTNAAFSTFAGLLCGRPGSSGRLCRLGDPSKALHAANYRWPEVQARPQLLTPQISRGRLSAKLLTRASKQKRNKTNLDISEWQTVEEVTQQGEDSNTPP